MEYKAEPLPCYFCRSLDDGSFELFVFKLSNEEVAQCRLGAGVDRAAVVVCPACVESRNLTALECKREFLKRREQQCVNT